jgi:hypothetical protein
MRDRKNFVQYYKVEKMEYSSQSILQRFSLHRSQIFNVILKFSARHLIYVMFP